MKLYLCICYLLNHMKYNYANKNRLRLSLYLFLEVVKDPFESILDIS